MKVWILALALAANVSIAGAQTPPPQAVIADPAPIPDAPARLIQVRYATGGVEVPARFFLAAGKGAHPTMLLLHGFPGTELNLDIARAVQRAGWNVLAIHYRGVWGAPGQFSLGHTVEDTRAALAALRGPAFRQYVRNDRIVLLGHSMGGFDASMVADDPAVAGFVVISAWDVANEAGKLATPEQRKAQEATFAEDIGFTNMSFASMADEIVAQTSTWNLSRNAARIAGRPLLVVSSNDGGKPADDAIAAAAGGRTTKIKFETDHSYNDHRIALQAAVVGWLQKTFP